MCSMCERVSVRWCLNTSALHASRIHSPRMLPVDSKVESEVSINHLPFLSSQAYPPTTILLGQSKLARTGFRARPTPEPPRWVQYGTYLPCTASTLGLPLRLWRPPALSRQRLMAALTHSGQAGIEGDMERYGAGRKHVVQT